jgi:formamidopyrimidine-DNA glycosylase
MPELPEVETIVSDLNKKITGYVITGFWSDWPKTIKNLSPEKFKKEINGKKVLRARRTGKNIFIELSGGKTLYIHLKMTGHLLIKSQIPNPKSQTNLKQHDYFKDRVNQYIHHKWTLEKGKNKINLEFSDVRKFGKIVLLPTEEIKNLSEIKKLGMDVMSSEFTLKKFAEILAKKKNRPIGLVLMEQELMSGIGNIYRSEILFDAKIHPERKIKELSAEKQKQIFRSIQKILKKAIKLRGTSDSDYRDTAGAPGNFQKVLRVYKRKDKKCKSCGIMIHRKKMGQRSVFFCPNCQK